MNNSMNRRTFLQAATATAVASVSTKPARAHSVSFQGPDSLYHGDDWESLNPGYWSIRNNALRRRIHNYGDRARNTGFPYHYETHGDRLGSHTMPVDYDPTLPPGLIWRRHWRLAGNYELDMTGRVHAPSHGPSEQDDPTWRMYQEGYGLLGLAFGSASLYESFGMSGPDGKAAWIAAWTEDGRFEIREHGSDRIIAGKQVPKPSSGDRFRITVAVSGEDAERGNVSASLDLEGRGRVAEIRVEKLNRARRLQGFAGIAGRGLLDFEVDEFTIDPGKNRPLDPRLNECHVCYALGDTLRQAGDAWQVRFIALFRNDGERAEVRIADTPDPAGGWDSIPAAGQAPIVNNDFRRNTAVIDATLPRNPAETDLYYTVWKDGRNVTADPRLGSDAVGIGTGQVGGVPESGAYVGRLPKLSAPYRLCGLSCHAIHGSRPNLPDAEPGGGFFVHDQPTPGAYRHLEEYGFQVMMWEDDVWYMELLLYPPSPDDAYKIVTTTLCGPTTRWQMMRHWNTINPGDHDYGMDDVKGPEQIAIRAHGDLGQDRDYMRRNFQIVHHLVTGDQAPSATANPKKWRRWKMPGGDFSLLILDSRLWRSSQDTNIWDDQGWGARENLYPRTDVTRSLLGEEQFAWLRETIRTDSSPLICLTGINGLHTIWTGDGRRPDARTSLGERDRVAADYAGWVAAGADRVLELLGSRTGRDHRLRGRAYGHDPAEPGAPGLRMLLRSHRPERRPGRQGGLRAAHDRFRRPGRGRHGPLPPELRHAGPAQAGRPLLLELPGNGVRSERDGPHHRSPDTKPGGPTGRAPPRRGPRPWVRVPHRENPFLFPAPRQAPPGRRRTAVPNRRKTAARRTNPSGRKASRPRPRRRGTWRDDPRDGAFRRESRRQDHRDWSASVNLSTEGMMIEWGII